MEVLHFDWLMSESTTLVNYFHLIVALSSQGQQENSRNMYVFEDLSTIRTITCVRSVQMSVIHAWYFR